jgi:hypothetical protein
MNMGQMKDLYGLLLDAIEKRIVCIIDSFEHMPSNAAIIDELTRFFTFDELMICKDGYLDFIDDYRRLLGHE